MLFVFSSGEIALSKAQQSRIWKSFMEGGTTHSANAGTLPYIMRRCERERIGYVLTALPGAGYHLKGAKHERTDASRA